MKTNTHHASSGAANPKVVAFLSLLAKAGTVKFGEQTVDHVDQDVPNGTADNQVVRLVWLDEIGPCSLTLTEGNIESGEWIDGNFYCQDCEGDRVQISMFGHYPITESSDGEQRYFALLDTGPPRQNTCRLHSFKLGAQMRERIGSIRTRIQRPSGSAHAAAGERVAGGGVA